MEGLGSGGVTGGGCQGERDLIMHVCVCVCVCMCVYVCVCVCMCVYVCVYVHIRLSYGKWL